MMKPMAALLLMMLFCVGMASAEDFSAYEVQTNGFPIFAPSAIMENGDMLFETWADRDGTHDEEHPWHLEWMRDGKVYRDMPFTDSLRHPWNMAFFMPVGEECYVLLPAVSGWAEELLGEAEYQPAAEVYRWTETGMEQIAAIPGRCAFNDIEVFDGGFALWDRESGALKSYRYDGTPGQSYPLGDGGNGNLLRISGMADGTLYATVSTSGYPRPACTVYALEDGQILWQRDYRWYVRTFCPGDGYLYVSWAKSDKPYSPIQIDRIDADGKVLLSRTLSADKLVLSHNLTLHPDNGHLMLCGKGVSASRNQFNAFVMELDGEMREVSLDVRSFCYYQDASFSGLSLPDGTCAVFSNGTYGGEVGEGEEPPASGVPVLVPFDALTPTGRNGIKIR